MLSVLTAASPLISQCGGEENLKKSYHKVPNKQPGIFTAHAKLLLRVLFPPSFTLLVCYTAVGFVVQHNN